MADRVTGNTTTRIETFNPLEPMFLVMRPDTKPWDNKLVRLAVAHAIDRDSIIKSLLRGYAQPLDGPVGPGQVAYSPEVARQATRMAWTWS
jgi:peptide/nickel transport system substrate-binding protein